MKSIIRQISTQRTEAENTNMQLKMWYYSGKCWWALTKVLLNHLRCKV